MRDHDRTRPSGKVRENEECAEPIMRQEADVPGSLTMPVGAPVAKPHPVSMPRYVRANMTESMWPSTQKGEVDA